MPSAWYDNEEYQEFLVSEERTNYIPDSVYQKLFKPPKQGEKTYILDFGTGMGHTALVLANRFEDFPDLHIYACEQQEILLDRLWYTLVHRKISRVTPFFLPSYSWINFPEWLPKMHHIVCSLGLSGCEKAEDVVQTLPKISTGNRMIHFLEWKAGQIPPEIEKIVPEEKQLDPGRPRDLSVKIQLQHHTKSLQ